MNKTKLETLLKANDVLRADRVCLPERFVEVFAVPAAKLGSAVIDVIEWTTALEDALKLAKLADVTARVKRDFDVRTQAEANLVRLMLYIARDDVMLALAQLGDEARANRSESAGDKKKAVESYKQALSIYFKISRTTESEYLKSTIRELREIVSKLER